MKKWIAAFLGFLPTTIFAQIPADETATVTASINPQLQRETGRNIIVLKGSLLQQMPVHSVDELLRYAAGMEVQLRGAQGAQSDLLIRGGTFQQVLVLIDGVRLNDPLTGHFSSYIPVHPAEIDRIEILKGNASAIYGSEAVGGVIHIITRAFTERNEPQGNKGGVLLSLGDFDLRNLSAHFRRNGEKTYWSAGLQSNNADGTRLRGTKGFFNVNTAQAAFSASLADNWRLNAKLGLDFRKFNAQNFYTTFVSDTANEEVNSLFSHVQLARTKGKKQFTADLSYKILRDEFQFSPFSVTNINRARQFIAQALYKTALTAESDFVTGFQAHNRTIRSNDRGDHGLWHGAVWALVKHRLGKKVFMNEGLRADWDGSYGLEFSPQMNFSYVPGRWSFRASAGKGIRDADFTERYNNYNRALVTSGRIGNPDLEAEQTWGMEAGADYLNHPSFKISGTVFYRNQRNLIDWSPTPYAQMPRKVNLSPTGNYALAKNLEQVKTYGAEIDLYYRKQWENQTAFTATAGLTRLYSENKDSVPSFYISAHAKWLANFGLLYEGEYFNLAVNGLYKERNTQKATAINAEITHRYFLLNLRVAGKLNNGKIQVFLQADNLTGTEYSDLLGAKMPGRWVNGGVAIAL